MGITSTVRVFQESTGLESPISLSSKRASSSDSFSSID